MMSTPAWNNSWIGICCQDKTWNHMLNEETMAITFRFGQPSLFGMRNEYRVDEGFMTSLSS
jgi:hypothetical protein